MQVQILSGVVSNPSIPGRVFQRSRSPTPDRALAGSSPAAPIMEMKQEKSKSMSEKNRQSHEREAAGATPANSTRNPRACSLTVEQWTFNPQGGVRVPPGPCRLAGGSPSRYGIRLLI